MTQEEDLKAELTQAQQSVASKREVILIALVLLERGDIEGAKEVLTLATDAYASRLLRKKAQP